MSTSTQSTELRLLKHRAEINGKRSHGVTDLVRMLKRILQRKKMLQTEVNKKHAELEKFSGAISYLRSRLYMLLLHK